VRQHITLISFRSPAGIADFAGKEIAGLDNNRLENDGLENDGLQIGKVTGHWLRHVH